VFLVCVICNVLQLLLLGFQAYSGSVPPTKMIMPIVMIVVFGWMATQSTKTK
jgi:ABC-type transport system involved in cytochrome c biogenesis permease subunit